MCDFKARLLGPNCPEVRKKSNPKISENNNIELVTGILWAGLVPLSILLRVQNEAVLFIDAGNRELGLLLVAPLLEDTLVGKVDALSGIFLDMCTMYIDRPA